MPLTEVPLELPGRVWASPMPYGDFDPGESVYPSFKNSGISVIVMLTEDTENMLRARRNLKSFYIDEGLTVLHVPIIDFSVPLKQDIAPVVTKAVELAGEGRNIAVHCHAGLGRTGIFSACMAKEHFDLSGDETMEWVTKNIPWVLWNTEQQNFVINY